MNNIGVAWSSQGKTKVNAVVGGQLYTLAESHRIIIKENNNVSISKH